jgi:hypothetical protein
VRRSWGISPPHFEKLRVAKLIPLLALNLRKKSFLLEMEAYKYPVSQGYKNIWIRVCLETIVTVLKIYKTNKEYIFGTFFIKM